jgi:arabinofuranosyltransferase
MAQLSPSQPLDCREPPSAAGPDAVPSDSPDTAGPAPGPASRFGRSRALLIWGMLALAALQVAIFHRTRHDDAFISYRYAQNLATGRGMVFNPGERVMGSTAPGHVLVAALAHRVVGHQRLPSTMAALGVLAWIAQAAAVTVLLAPTFGGAAAGLAGLLVALGLAESGRWVALETNVVVALDLWALVLALRGRLLGAGALAGLAALTRPDAMVFAALLLAWVALRHRRRVLFSGLALAAVLGPWVVFSRLYFGSVLPQSAIAKFQVVDLPTYLAHTLRHLGALPIPALPGDLVAALAWVSAAVGAVVLIRRRRELWILPAFVLAHAAAYLYLRPFVPHLWHLYPIRLVFAVLVLVALLAALQHRLVALRAVAAVVVVALAGTLVWKLRGAPESLETPYFRERHTAYVAISELLRERARPDDSVLALEVGTLAYYTDLAMVDLGLLVTRGEEAELRGSRFLMFDRLYWPQFPDEVRELSHFLFRAGEFEAYLFDLETPENRVIRARQRRAAATAGD